MKGDGGRKGSSRHWDPWRSSLFCTDISREILDSCAQEARREAGTYLRVDFSWTVRNWGGVGVGATSGYACFIFCLFSTFLIWEGYLPPPPNGQTFQWELQCLGVTR